MKVPVQCRKIRPGTETFTGRRQRLPVPVDPVQVSRTPQPLQNFLTVSAAAQGPVHIDSARSDVEQIHRFLKHYADMFKSHCFHLPLFMPHQWGRYEGTLRVPANKKYALL